MSNERELRVLHVDSGSRWRGGQRQVLLLMRGLGEVGATAELAAPEMGRLYQLAAGVASRRHNISIAGGADLSAVTAIRRLIRNRHYDIVHAHDSHAHSAVTAATLGMRGRLGVVVSRRMDSDISANWFSKFKYLRGADLYLAISSSVREALVGGGVDPERVRIIPSGIDLESTASLRPRKRMREELGFDGAGFVVGTVGALTREKGYATLLRSAELVLVEHPDTRFAIAGDGPLRSELERAAARWNAGDRVRFLGHREDALDVMNAFDAFVLASTTEGLGSSIMDAHAIGLPVVASNIGGIPDVVSDGETGLLVPSGDVDALAGAIIRLLKDEGLRERLIDAGKSESIRYDFRRMVYKTVEAYRELRVGRKRS